MSAQRYHPSDHRYAPADESRFPPRDRSPPRYGGDRFASSSTYRPGYQNRPDESRDSAGTSVNRDAPRGPKSTFDAPRTNAPFSPGPPRGRGFPARGDYRGAARAADAPRDSRDQPSWIEDRDRSSSWAERDTDRRDRRLSSPARARPPEFRDFREPAPPSSRDYDFNRSRAGARDQAPAAGASYEPRRDSFSSRGRGYLSRGRTRSDWDVRSRDRDGFADDRPGRSRSRSPARDFRADREPLRNRDSFEPRDERRFDGREDRPIDKADRDRNLDRFNRERSPFRNDSRRPSASSTAASSPRPMTPPLGPQPSAARPFNDPARPPSALRRVSASVDRWEDRRESSNADTQDSRERQDSRPSSPPPPIQVPAFGWNVWKAPTEPKAMKQTPIPTSTAPPTSIPPNAPTGPKLTPSSTGLDKLVKDKQPPTGPKGDQPVPSLRTAANVHPQRLNRMQSQPGVASPPVSPTLVAPSGPRAIAASVTAPNLGSNVPTGPKIDRAQPQPPSWTPSGPSPSSTRQWQRQSSQNHPGKSGLVVPAKRDFSGDERIREFSEQSAQVSANRFDRQKLEQATSTQSSATAQVSENGAFRDAGESDIKPPRSPAWGDDFESSSNAAGATTTGNRPEHDDGDDLMELDEDDFEKKEQRFQRDKARLESELVDLGAPELRGSHALGQLAILGCIYLSSFPSRTTQPVAPTSNEQAVLGTGHLLTPKAELLTQNAIPIRKPAFPAEPAPIGSPELQALPFLHKGPPTPIEDLDIYKQNAALYRQVGPDLEEMLKERLLAKQEDERVREDEYGDLYVPWMSLVEQVDKERKEETPVEDEPEPGPPVPLLDAPILSTTPSEPRRRGGISEYDIERVLQESLETANRENARRMKLELSAKIDHEKEAAEKPQKDADVRDEHDFIDKNTQISVTQAVSRWNFEPPIDNVSQEDHELLVKNFREFPKKWGRIAQAIENDGGGTLTYKDCINHYYATKWNQEYKERRDKRRQRGGKGSRLRGGQGRPKANALISNLGDVRMDLYDGDEFAANVAVTDSGRPKRAAAPTFGEKEAEEQIQQTAQTPARRGPKGSDQVNGNNEKPARRSRGSTKERGGRKPRGQGSMRTRSTSPEKADIDSTRRALMETRLSNGTQSGEFDVAEALAAAGSGIVPQPPGSSRGATSETSHLVQGNGLVNESTNTTTSQQPRSGPSSYWSVQEVSAFPTYLAHYGTDWAGIAQKMESKTGTMVKNYYFRLIGNNNRQDLEDLVRKADQKRQRGEQTGPIDPPALQTKKRGEGSQPSAPRPLAPSAETIETGDGPPYRATSSTQPGRTAHQSYSPISQRASVHVMGPQGADLGPDRSESSIMQGRRNDPTSVPSNTAQRHGPAGQSSRTAQDYEGQARQAPPASLQHLHGRPFSEASLPSNQQPLTTNSSRYYPVSPQQRMSHLSMTAAGHRNPHSDIEDRQYPRPQDPSGHRASYGIPPSMQRYSPPQQYGEVRRSRPTSPVLEQNRFAGTSSQLPIQPPPAPRTEPRKMSNLSAILNHDEPPKKSNNQPSHLSTVTPPPSQQYPQRPASHPDRGLQYSEPDRPAAAFPRSSFGQQNAHLSRPQSEIASRESQPSSQSSRPDWHGQPSFAPLSSSSQPGYRPHLLDRAPPNSASMEYHRSSLQSLSQRHVASPPPSLNQRHAPSPPPSLGFNHPSQYVQSARQQIHQRPSPPSQSLQLNSYPPSTSSSMQQNQEAYQQNSNLGAPPQPQSMSQRTSAYESFGGRSEAEYRPRHDSLSGPKDEDVHIPRERAPQSRSNLRPDSFLVRDYRNPVKQPAQSRQLDLDQARPYVPRQDEQRRPISPRVTQTYTGRTPDQQSPPSGRG